jgi:hypothetical protein
MTEPITAADVDRLHAVALLDLAADENAQRCYRAATAGDLRKWLSRVPNRHPRLDAWTLSRRVDLMRRELAKRQAELCNSREHAKYGYGPAELIGDHVAVHLAQLRGQ